jgi:DEAD/DEAH box helicase domain-containing protein
VLVAQDDPLDQYLVNHPQDLFDKPAEAAVIDPSNPYVVAPHVACAAREQPLSESELQVFFGEPGVEAAGRLEDEGILVRRRGMLHHRDRRDPRRRQGPARP